MTHQHVIPFQPQVVSAQILMEGVHVDYPGHPDALRDVSISIRKGERVAVIGPSGCGKSTLLKTINGLLTVARGQCEVRCAGLQRRDSARPRVAMIFQEFALAQRLSVLTNVLIGCLGRTPSWKSALGVFASEDKQQARMHLDAVGLRGYEHKRVDQLSSGQKQRVAIARALMQEQELLLADEPVASLDVKTSLSVLELLSQLQHKLGFTLVMSLHDIEQARGFCDRVIGIKSGRVVFDGLVGHLDQRALNMIFETRDVLEHLHG
jgi:phosphonate transport system ATP-binding protein